MIIKQYLDVITGRKTQTRRMKPTYNVGSVLSVVPKMYQPAVWYRFNDNGDVDVVLDAIRHVPTFNGYHSEVDYDNTTRIDRRDSLKERGYIPLKIRITGKREECLQDISELDARAEGVYWSGKSLLWEANAHGKVFTGYSPMACYANLWNSINTKKGARWEDNPIIYVYTFELVKG